MLRRCLLRPFVLMMVLCVGACFVGHALAGVSGGGMKRVILIGPPASGKGTQGEFIQGKFGIPKISTGDLLRLEVSNNTEIGQKAKSIMEAGQLVNDEIILEILQKRLSLPDTKNGFILDGFPRTLSQARALKSLNVEIDYVVELDVPDSDIVKRISGRRFHPGSGRTYHIVYNPPKVEGKDDVTGEPLIQRKDDTREVILMRLTDYHQQTAPVVDWYQALSQKSQLHYFKIDGTKAIKDIQKDISLNLSN